MKEYKTMYNEVPKNEVPYNEVDAKNVQNIGEYINNMDEKHKQAYLIAKDHLKSSFDIERSNGFKEYKKNKTLSVQK